MIVRRESATVVYTDLAHFTALAEALDPERVTDVVNDCFERLEAIVIASGGKVVEYLGDCVVSAYGIDRPSDDTAQAALAAAIQMAEAVRSYDPGDGIESRLDVHIGIATGPVVAATIESGERHHTTLSGEAVTLAAALEERSQAGEILAGPRTREQAGADFDFKAAGSVTIGARRRDFDVFAVTGAGSKRDDEHRASERRQATVVFAELRGEDGALDTLDPDALMAVLGDCIPRFESIVIEHGGVVDKTVGNSVMALFGVPNAIENAPQQAINAAIALRESARARSASGELPLAFQIRIGINSGLVIAGEIGGRVRRDYSVIGSAVNIASRIKDSTPLDNIHVGPNTFAAVQGAFEFAEPVAQSFRGAEQAIVIRALESDRERIHRTRAVDTSRSISSDLVGRDDEVVRLQRRIHALRDGQGSIVSVVGGAGVGKSRLVSEVLERSELAGVRVLVGRAAPTGANLSFHPFVDLLQNWANIQEEDDNATELEKLAVAIDAVLPERREEVLPYVATVMGIRLPEREQARLDDMDAEGREKLIYKNLRELFESISRREPLLVVIEDLHWADASSGRLLESMLRLVESRTLLLVNLMRPDESEVAAEVISAAAISHADRYEAMALEPLDEQHAAMLVENLLAVDDLPVETRRTILEKSEGHPFFIEEVVRSLIEQGAVEESGGRYRVTERIHAVEIPGTVQEVVLARIDRLDEPTRHLVQLAAVVGRTFSYGVLCAILREVGRFDDSVPTRLSDLGRKQILTSAQGQWQTPVGDRDEIEEIEYVFTHAMAQQAIYESILLQTRKQLHGAVGRTIETAFASRLPEFYGMLAYHFGRAEVLEKAEDYLFRAGEEAARSAASSEALTFFEEASRLYLVLNPDGGDPWKRMMLERNIALAQWNKGNLSQSIDHFNRTLSFLGEQVPRNALQLYARFASDFAALLVRLYLRGVSTRRPAALDREKMVMDVIYDRSRAQATSEDALRMFMDNLNGIRRLSKVDPAIIDQACGMYATSSGLFAFAAISFDISRRFLNFAEHAMRPDDVRDRFSFETFRFIHGLLSGNWSDELAIEPALVDEALRAGQIWDVNTYVGLDCDRLFRRGRFDEAEEQLARLAVLRDEYGYEFASSNHDGTLAMFLLERRRTDEALDVADRYYVTRHEPSLRVLALGTKAKLQVLRGDLDDATATFERMTEIANAAGAIAPWHGGNGAVARLLHAIALYERDGRKPRGLARARRGAIAVAAGAAEHRTEVSRALGTLAWLEGSPRKATRHWNKAVQVARQLDATPELARTYAEFGHRASQSPRLILDNLSPTEATDRAASMAATLGMPLDPH